MKKLCFLMAILALIAAMVSAALADSTVENNYILKSRDVELNEENNTLSVLDPNTGKYGLLNAQGRALTDQPFILLDSEGIYFEAAISEGLNVRGLIDAEGQEVMPMQYGDIEYISDRWQLGVVLEDATVDNYDYKSFDGDFYLITTLDVYFMGEKVGSLSRTEYSYAQPYGNFLYVKDKAGNYAYYDKDFVKSAYDSEYPGSSEYEENYKDNSVWHRGSNQKAFTAGCTLTADDVDQSIYALNGQFFDLQGNLLFKAVSPYDTVYDYEGDYAKVKAYGKYGLIDRAGNEVVPCEYDEISCNEAYLASGYQVAVKDGKVGYVNAQGQETCEFKYSSELASAYRSPFNYLKDLDGSYIVLSGAVGELPGRYEEIGYSNSEYCPLLVVAQDGKAGVIDLAGTEVVPLNENYDVYDYTVSNDGSLVLQYNGDSTYTVYQIANAAAISAAPAELEATAEMEAEPAQAEAPQPETEPVEGWTCADCGQENSGNFCTNCGAARPVEDEIPKCANCGYVPADGTAPKFCPECGTAFAAE